MPTDAEVVRKALQEVRKLLPLQNPLHVFIHNNILMEWEDQPFWPAVERAAILYRAKPYREFSFYTQAYQSGRIQKSAFFKACESFLQKKDLWITPTYLSRETEVLSTILLQRGEHIFPRLTHSPEMPSSLFAFLVEKNPLISLWHQGSSPRGGSENPHPILAEPVPGTDCYTGLFEISRLLESFMDQGVSPWSNPFVTKGFIPYVTAYFSSKAWVAFPWQARFTLELRGVAHMDSDTALCHALSCLHCPREHWETLLVETAFLLKGWGGLVHRLEVDPSLAPVHGVPMGLADLLIVNLLFLHSCHVKLHLPPQISEIKKTAHAPIFSFLLHEMIHTYSELEIREWGWKLRFDLLLTAIASLDRNRLHQIWHEAYEIQLYEKTIALLALPRLSVSARKKSNSIQMLFCIDDREESLRRHIEYLRPDIDTHGVLAFFGVAPSMAHHIDQNRSRKEYATFSFFHMSKSILWGFISSLALGFLSFFPLVLRIMSPGLSGRFTAAWQHIWAPKSLTTLDLTRREDPIFGAIGYSLEEQADLVFHFLRLSSLQNQLDGIVLLLAHGSTSANNPFCQSYGCGACGGQSGGVNAQVFAQIANQAPIRTLLQQRGLSFSHDVWFVAAQHDTTSDEILLYDLKLVPTKFHSIVSGLHQDLQRAAKINAYERIRRFPNAPFFYKKRVAAAHVQARAQNLAEPRPEYGHTGVAMAIFGRRTCTQHLFLDRRAFLVSYDPFLDADGSILFDILVAALPVCANINLDYFFSSIDNQGFGAGSKLPLNISALLGVVTGGGGDIRIGLAAQMVEKHEPVRCLVVVEAELDHLQNAISGSNKLAHLVHNHWIRMVCLHPTTQHMMAYTSTGWTSIDMLPDFLEEKEKISIYSSKFENLPSQKRLHILTSESQE